jgi:hypothetical protein
VGVGAPQLSSYTGSFEMANSSEAERLWIELVHCKILHERKLNTRVEFVSSRIEPLA